MKRAMLAGLALVFLISTTAAQTPVGYIDTIAGNYDPAGTPAAQMSLVPMSIRIDAADNMYVATGGYVFKIDAQGRTYIVAGRGTGCVPNAAPTQGDGGPAVLANFGSAADVALDAQGNLYISDDYASRVRRVDAATGIITTFAGAPNVGVLGDGGPATSARLQGPSNSCADALGNIYIADTWQHRIRKVDSTGIITTVAGMGHDGFSGDGGPATSAMLHTPAHVACGATGVIYISDTYNRRVRKVDLSTGIISTIAGGGSIWPTPQGGFQLPATSVALNSTLGLALVGEDTLLIGDAQALFKLTLSTGVLTRVTGCSETACVPFRDGGPALEGGGCADDVAVDSAGNIYVACASLSRIRKIDAATQIITTFAGDGFRGMSGDGGPAVTATVPFPRQIARDAAGNLFVSEQYDCVVRRIDAATGVISRVAGTGVCMSTEASSVPASQTPLTNPIGMTVDAAGNLFVTDYHAVRRVDAVTGLMTTVAGTYWNGGYSGDGGPAVQAILYFPWDLAVDQGGNLFIADYYNHRIRKVDAVTGIITTFAGNGTTGVGGDGGPATSAQVENPKSVVLDSAGNLYIAHTNTPHVRKVDAVTGVISTIAGVGTVFPGYDGPAISAEIHSPIPDLAVDAAGNVYFANSDNTIARVDAATGILTRAAGTGTLGFAGDGGPALDAMLSWPTGLAIDSDSNLYIVDHCNNRIRGVMFTPPNTAPTALCADVTAPAGTDCTALASIDAGSNDPDSDAITLAQSPPGPYALGVTEVTLTVSDEDGATGACSAAVTVVDSSPPALTCPADVTLECPANTSADVTGLAAAMDACTGPIVPFYSDTPAPVCGATQVLSRLFTAYDAAGNNASCPQTITIADTLAPALAVDTTPITVTDAECSRDEAAPLPTATAADACDSAPLITNNAPATFPAGQTTTVTYTAADACSNTSSAAVTVTVLQGASLSVDAYRHTVGNGTHPGTTKEPLVGIRACAYDTTEGACPWTTCLGITHKQFACIVNQCAPAGCCTTDAAGACTIGLTAGHYHLIGSDSTGLTLPTPIGANVGDVACGATKAKSLRQIVNARGDKLAAKYEERTGSNLLIVEPEEIVWDETQELYPFVLDAAGDWTETATVEPPEGFVRDYDTLTDQAVNEVTALQFVLTDVGTRWDPMVTRHIVRHNGRVEVVLNEIGTLLGESFARGKGLDRWGRSLAEVGEGAPEPRIAAPAARLIGWIEPSDVDSGWTFRVRADRATSLELTIESLGGQALAAVTSGSVTAGEHGFAWSGDGERERALNPRSIQVRITADGVDRAYRLRLPQTEKLEAPPQN